VLALLCFSLLCSTLLCLLAAIAVFAVIACLRCFACFGMVLGSVWDRFRMVLGCFSDQFGIFVDGLVMFWEFSAKMGLDLPFGK